MHRHYCKGDCGAFITCRWPLVQDACEKEVINGQYECEECREERLEAEDYADAVAERERHQLAVLTNALDHTYAAMARK